MTVISGKPLRIGEVAELTALTPRTIRYYEEIGLLPGGQRVQGKHRLYTSDDVERIREVVRLRDLLGISLEQLSKLLEAEAARAELRREFQRAEEPGRRRMILQEALGHIDNQLALVRERQVQLAQLEAELRERRAVACVRLAELGK
jgi:DNA-binding transcriptional MerR regulator